MKYKKIDNNIISEFLEFLNKDQIISEKESKLPYSKDETEDLVYIP